MVVCFAIVHDCSDGEDQLGLYLREPIEHTLSQKSVKMLKQYEQTNRNNQNTEELQNGSKLVEVCMPRTTESMKCPLIL